MGCTGCCQGLHTAGFQTLVMLVQACDCGDAGGCATTCATEYCKNAMFASQNDACATCISNSLAPGDAGACYNSVLQGCMNDSGCTAYLGCTNPMGGSCAQ
jgi:hypothetical protein